MSFGTSHSLLKFLSMILLSITLGVGCAQTAPAPPKPPLSPRITGEAPKQPDRKTPDPEKKAEVIAFRTLAHSDNGGPSVVTIPTLFVLDGAPDERFFQNLMGGDTGLRSALKKLGSRERIIAFMSGRFPSGGYTVMIREISVQPGVVNIRVKLDEPAPDTAQTDAQTEPIHMVVVSWDDLKKAWDSVSQVVWTVTDLNGNRLLEVTQRQR